MTIAVDLINLKDVIHQKWFDLQYTKRADKKHAFLQKPLYDEVIRLGHQALDILKRTDPESVYIQRIEIPLHQAERKSWLAEDIGYIGPKPYYVMTPDAGQVAITWDINHLANAIHHAGMSLIKSDGEYCGCEISEGIKDLSSINAGAMKYCEGALRKGDYEGRSAILLEPGDRIEHRPGSAGTHANVVRFVPTEKGIDIDMHYTESGDDNWSLRQDGVTDFIRTKKGDCETAELTSKCHIESPSEEDIMDLALFVSQLKDIDLLDENCIPLALELITEQAKELKLTQPEKIWNQPWTRVGNMSEIIDCRQGHYDEEEERRRRSTLYQRLERSIENMEYGMNHAIKYSQREPCVCQTYNMLAHADYENGIREACKEIKAKTDEAWSWCMDLADERANEYNQAAKDLVSRCPPEGIILAQEARDNPLLIDRIEDICNLAENEDCLAIIKQVQAREAAGIKPQKLELKMERE